MNTAGLAIRLHQLRLEVHADLGEDGSQPVDCVAIEHPATVFRHKDQVGMHLENAMPSRRISLSLLMDQTMLSAYNASKPSNMN